MKELDEEVTIRGRVCVWRRDGVSYAQGCKQECAAQGSRNYKLFTSSSSSQDPYSISVKAGLGYESREQSRTERGRDTERERRKY